MYFNVDTLHFRLNELLGVSYICSIFDKGLSKRINDIYHYHKDVLKENDMQPLQYNDREIERYRLEKCIFKKVEQLEFVFSDDEDIF